MAGECAATGILAAAGFASADVDAARMALHFFVIFTFARRTAHGDICASAAVRAAVAHRFSRSLLKAGAARLVLGAGGVSLHLDISLTAEFIFVVNACLCCTD